MNELRDRVIAALRTVRDPEIPVNIYDLGLVYEIVVDEPGDVSVRMTLTAPACPIAQDIVRTVEERLRAVEGVGDVQVELVWDPPWTRDRMSEAAQLELGLF